MSDQPDLLAVKQSVPDEGDLKNNRLPFAGHPDIPGSVSLSFEEADRIAHLPFEGKHISFGSVNKQPNVDIIVGAPGGGKGALARKIVIPSMTPVQQEATIGIAYDEPLFGKDGALFNIPEYVDVLEKVDPRYKTLDSQLDETTYGNRKLLWNLFRPLSQKIRSMTFNRAIEEKFSLLIDTTGSSPGTFRMMDTLRDNGYDNICLHGVYAPFELSRERVKSRPRPGDLIEDLVKKRIGFLDQLPKYCQDESIKSFKFYYNPDNASLPCLAFHFSHGKLQFADINAVRKIQESLDEDRDIIKAEIDALPDHQLKDLDLDEYNSLLHHYAEAANACYEYLQAIQDKFPNPPDTSVFPGPE